MSPCEQSLAERENDGVPIDESVADILFAIIPLFPTPHKITFDWQLTIAFTALSKFLFRAFFNFCKALISKSITSFAIFLKFVFFKYSVL